MPGILPGIQIALAILSARRDLDGVKACKRLMKLVFRHLGDGGPASVVPMLVAEAALAHSESRVIATNMLCDHCRRCGKCDMAER